MLCSCYMVPEVRVQAGRLPSSFDYCMRIFCFERPPPTRPLVVIVFFTRKYFYIYRLRKWFDRKKLSNILRTRIGFESEVINNLKVESASRTFFIYSLTFMQREIRNLNLVVDDIARYFSKKSSVCKFLFLSNY